jgi:NAD(P)-dependent dehydrogenase (short-subunit alcohol dehydrogenase family)
VRERFGRLDVLINNAGIGRFGPLVDFASADLRQLAAVNLLGTFWCCQQAMRLMIPQRRGYIINISSVVGFKGYPNQAAYTATKHAVMGLTKSLAVEAQAHGIRVIAQPVRWTWAPRLPPPSFIHEERRRVFAAARRPESRLTAVRVSG